MMIHVRHHKAIAMIELIFAIVVLGIALLSVPNLIYTATQSGYAAMNQESISQAAADMSLLLTRRWDENNTHPSLDPTILTTDSTTSGLTLATRDNLHSRTYYRSNGDIRAASLLQSDGGDMDDIDDVPTSTAGYIADGAQNSIDTIAVGTAVVYLNDTATWSGSTITFNNPFIATAPTGTSNIKGVTMTLTSGGTTPELQKTIRLRAFSCNIGSYKLERRLF